MTAQQLADLWYLKYGYSWVSRTELDKDWKNISRELMRNNLADYDTLTASQNNIIEIVKLKKTYK